jgi:hypothetical protein
MRCIHCLNCMFCTFLCAKLCADFIARFVLNIDQVSSIKFLAGIEIFYARVLYI